MGGGGGGGETAQTTEMLTLTKLFVANSGTVAKRLEIRFEVRHNAVGELSQLVIISSGYRTHVKFNILFYRGFIPRENSYINVSMYFS